MIKVINSEEFSGSESMKIPRKQYLIPFHRVIICTTSSFQAILAICSLSILGVVVVVVIGAIRRSKSTFPVLAAANFLGLPNRSHTPTPTTAHLLTSPLSTIIQTMPSHKSVRTKIKLAKAARQNRPVPQWIRLRYYPLYMELTLELEILSSMIILEV